MVYPRKKLFKCYNGVDETLFYPINRKYPLKRPIVIDWCGQPAQKCDQHGFQIIKQIIKILENNNNFIFKINAKNYTTAIPFNKMNDITIKSILLYIQVYTCWN